MGYLHLATLVLLVHFPSEALRPSPAIDGSEPDESDQDPAAEESFGNPDVSASPEDSANQKHHQDHQDHPDSVDFGHLRPPPINYHLWQILAANPSLLQDLHRHPRCLQVLAMALQSNATENDDNATTVTERRNHWSQDQRLVDELEKHHQCSNLLLGVLVKTDPYWLLDLLKGHPEGVLLLEAFLIGVLTYFTLSHVIRGWALHVASSIKDPLACLNDPAPPVPHVLSWMTDALWSCCRANSDAHDPGSNDGKNLESAWKGLELAQRTHMRSVMNKTRSLQVAGIAEQRVAAAWKLIEMAAAALTPIFISIEGMFGSRFCQPLKVVAILLSLVTTVCSIAPKNQATAILDYHSRLRKLVFSFWSLTGIFDVYDNEDKAKIQERPSMDDPMFQKQRAAVYSHFVMVLSKEVQDAENDLKDAYSTNRLTKDQVKKLPLFARPGGGNGQGDDGKGDDDKGGDQGDTGSKRASEAVQPAKTRQTLP